VDERLNFRRVFRGLQMRITSLPPLSESEGGQPNGDQNQEYRKLVTTGVAAESRGRDLEPNALVAGCG